MGHEKLIVAVAIVVFWPLKVAADPLDDIVASLKKRRDDVKSVSYRVAGTKHVTKFSLGEGPLADHKSPVDVTLTIDFENGWVLKRKKYELFDADNLKFVPRSESVFYDGTTVKTYRHYDKATRESLAPTNADVYVKTLDADADVWCIEEPDYPMLLYHGYLLSADNPDFRIQRIGSVFDRGSLRVSGEGKIANTTCHVVRDVRQGSQTFEYWISKDSNHDVLRMDCLAQGKLWHRTDITVKRYLGRTVPDSWIARNVDVNGQVRWANHYRVQEIVLNKKYTQTDFQGDSIETGQIIRDGDRKGFYRVDEEGVLQPILRKGTRSSSMLVYVVGVVFVGALFLYWFRKRRPAPSV